MDKLLDFITKIDDLKSVYRQTYVINEFKKENSAEHSWHLAISVLFLEKYSDGADIYKCVKMALIHDLAEIIVGDKIVYDVDSDHEKKEREAMISLLSNLDDGNEYLALWDEFNEGKTKESKFVKTLDRVLPLMNNYKTQGKSWKEHNVTDKMVLEKIEFMKTANPALYEYMYNIILESVEKNYLKGAKKMKIAITYEKNMVFQHFGKCPCFLIVNIEDNKVVSKFEKLSGNTGHGALGGMLKNLGVELLICGGIGGGAKDILAANNIKIISGISGNVDDVLNDYLNGTLKENNLVTCNCHEHEDHDCGCH